MCVNFATWAAKDIIIMSFYICFPCVQLLFYVKWSILARNKMNQKLEENMTFFGESNGKPIKLSGPPLNEHFENGSKIVHLGTNI